VIVLPGYCQSGTWIPEEALCPCLPPNYALPDADLGLEKHCPRRPRAQGYPTSATRSRITSFVSSHFEQIPD
jgi:hypothetical protein